ncbi:MAG: DUF262 domain-containing protein [Deltaproteobacteria bacterium]|nr:MAG: DUF262 domain-containing protein [Deltaproteobacteria bacterium]
MDCKPRAYSINDFLGWDQKGELILAPEFQRRDVWTSKAKSYLIDTILRRLPIPIIFVRQKVDLVSKKTKREVVDGQQRLRAIIDFVNNKWPIHKVHNAEYGGNCFEDLPRNVQERFLSYELSVVVLETAEDTDVLDIFARLNSYTEKLTPQELLNAQFNGAFKQCIYGLARSHLEFWRNHKILTPRQILRMAECELVSEIVIAVLDGLQDKKKSMKRFYQEYDDEFPHQKKVERHFRKVIDLLVSIWGRDGLSQTVWRRKTLFYSLFLGLYDVEFGLPKSKFSSRSSSLKIRPSSYARVRQAIEELGDQVTQDTPTEEYYDFVIACKQQTDNIKPRQARHKFVIRSLKRALS